MALRMATCGELKHQTFVHYGSNKFDKEKFKPLEGNQTSDKPAGGYWCCKNAKKTRNEWKNFVDMELDKPVTREDLNVSRKKYKDAKGRLKELKETEKMLVNSYASIVKIRDTRHEIKKLEEWCTDLRESIKSDNKKLQNSHKGINEKHYTRIKPGAKILKINSVEDYLEMVQKFPHEDVLNKMKYSDRIENAPYTVDFHKLAQEYDGMHVSKKALSECSRRDFIDDSRGGVEMEINNKKVLFSKYDLNYLYGWDLDSLVIFNPDVISDADEKVTSYNKKDK